MICSMEGVTFASVLKLNIRIVTVVSIPSDRMVIEVHDYA
jgi:hypothetical protein